LYINIFQNSIKLIVITYKRPIKNTISTDDWKCGGIWFGLERKNLTLLVIKLIYLLYGLYILFLYFFFNWSIFYQINISYHSYHVHLAILGSVWNRVEDIYRALTLFCSPSREHIRWLRCTTAGSVFPRRGRPVRRRETKRLAVAGGVGRDRRAVAKGVMGFYGGEEEKLIHAPTHTQYSRAATVCVGECVVGVWCARGGWRCWRTGWLVDGGVKSAWGRGGVKLSTGVGAQA